MRRLLLSLLWLLVAGCLVLPLAAQSDPVDSIPTAEATEVATIPPSETPLPVPTEAEIATLTEVPSATPIITETPSATAEIFLSPTATLMATGYMAGYVRYQAMVSDNHAGIAVRAYTPERVLVGTTVTNSNGLYHVPVPLDSAYWLVVDAPLYQQVAVGVIPGMPVPDIILPGGDLNDDGCVTGDDLTRLLDRMANGLPTDFNADGLTDIADLAILTGNIKPACEVFVPVLPAATPAVMITPTVTPVPATLTPVPETPEVTPDISATAILETPEVTPDISATATPELPVPPATVTITETVVPEPTVILTETVTPEPTATMPESVLPEATPTWTETLLPATSNAETTEEPVQPAT